MLQHRDLGMGLIAQWMFSIIKSAVRSTGYKQRVKARNRAFVNSLAG